LLAERHTTTYFFVIMCSAFCKLLLEGNFYFIVSIILFY
jgi:hypothetical protein